MTDATQPRMARGTKLAAAVVAAALFALLAFAPFASAASDPVGGGSTKLVVKKGFKKKLNKKKVKLQKLKPGTLKGRTVGLKVTGGNYDPATGQGKVTNGGGFKLKYGKRTAAVKIIEVNTVKKQVRAKVANKTMKLANLGKQFPSTRDGFGTAFAWGKVKLTGKAAKRLNNKLGLKKAFKGGNVLSNVSGTAQPSEATLVATGNAQLDLSLDAVKKLAHVGTPPFPEGTSPVAVALAPVAPTEVLNPGPPPSVAFPITGGRLSPEANAGTLQTAGGLKLVQNLEALTAEEGNITTLTMGNIWVDMATLQASVEVTIENPKNPEANLGNLGRASIADISLAGATITSDPLARTISVQNASATLQAVTAETLNQVFIDGIEKAPGFEGQEKFAAGDPLGTFSFVATAQ